MKNLYLFIALTVLLLSANQSIAQTIWEGPNITFSKAANADWTMEANQDRITDDIWITRANNMGIFNIAQETEFEGDGDENFGNSPAGTEWAFGRTSDGVENLDFTTWIVATTVPDIDGLANPSLLVDSNMVVHLIDDDIYIDIKFLSWGQGQNGGGEFSYERATDETTSTDEIDLKQTLKVFPNPATNYLEIQNLTEAQNIQVLDILGTTVLQKFANLNDRINTELLTPGVYFIRTEDGRISNFVKQ